MKRVESKIALGEYDIEIKRTRAYTWDQLVERYFPNSRRKKSGKTVKREQQVINAFSAFLNGEAFLLDIKKPTIEGYKAKRLATISRRKTPISPDTVSIELRILKTMFNMALEWKMVNENPVNRVPLPKKGITKVRFLHQAEVERLLQVIADAGDTDFRDLVIAYLRTGARRFELLDPQFGWDHINRDDRKLLIDGKGLRQRHIPIDAPLERVLQRRVQQGGEFPFDYHPDTVTHKLANYLKVAGIEGANVHSLRKTFGSMIIQRDPTQLLHVSRLLGHASIRTTESYYVDLLDANLRDAVGYLDGQIPE